MSMLAIDTILAALHHDRLTDFSGFCRGLGEHCPRQPDDDARRAAWRRVWMTLEEAEQAGLVTVERDATGRYEQALLTKAGHARICEKLDAERGLFAMLDSVESIT